MGVEWIIHMNLLMTESISYQKKNLNVTVKKQISPPRLVEVRNALE